MIKGAIRGVSFSRCSLDIARKDLCPSCVSGVMLMVLTSALTPIIAGSHNNGCLSSLSSVLRVLTARFKGSC